MPYRTDIAYVYDGSFDGLLCCVFESYYKRELPFAIFDYNAEQESLFARREILTNPENAKRVENSIIEKISRDALELVRMCYLSNTSERELAILNFLRMGYKIGGGVVDMLAHDTVRPITKAARNVGGEAHLFKGFLRFSDFGGTLAAVFEPKNFILPLIAPHFCDRLANEDFLIYDKNHNYVFTQQKGKKQLLPLEHFELPEACETEKAYRQLWKQFYNTIAIEGRINPKLQQGMMPKRYRTHMTEFL